MLEYSTILGACFEGVATVFYISAILAGRAKPNRVTFILWAATPLISAAASFVSGVRWAVLPVFVIGLSPVLILFVSFRNKNSYWETRPFDYICGFFSILALVLWRATHQPNVAIFFSILGDFLATLPTLRKSWTHPGTEPADSYVFALLNILTAFLAIKEFSFSSCAFPIYWTLMCVAILFALWRKKIAAVFIKGPKMGDTDASI